MSKKKTPVLRAEPETNPMLTKYVDGHMPPNFDGTKAQYMAHYKSLLRGLREQVENALAREFGDMVRHAKAQLADGFKPIAEATIAIKFNFEDEEKPAFAGAFAFTAKQKHKVPMAFEEDLNPKQPLLALESEPSTPTDDPSMSETKKQVKNKKGKARNKGMPDTSTEAPPTESK